MKRCAAAYIVKLTLVLQKRYFVDDLRLQIVVKTAMEKEQTRERERYTRTIASGPSQGAEKSSYRRQDPLVEPRRPSFIACTMVHAFA